MILIFVLLLGIIGLSIALSLYSGFLPYFSLLKDIKQYNMAYYGANTSIERSLLVLRQQEAGYESNGGWNNERRFAVSSDLLPGAGILPTFDGNNYMNWTIKSRTTDGSIPLSGNGNSPSSLNYNILKYGQTQTIPLWIDDTSKEQAYDKDEKRLGYYGDEIDLYLHLPNDVRESFLSAGLSDDDIMLCDENCDSDGDGVMNDIVVGRRFDGLLNHDISNPFNFSILPKNIIGRFDSMSDLATVSQDDSSIRESDINSMVSYPGDRLSFSSFNPLESLGHTNPSRNGGSEHLMIGNSIIFNNYELNKKGFTDIFQYGSDLISNLDLKLTLQQNLLTKSSQIYPYLEYRIVSKSPDSPISQPFFYVEGESKVGDYIVKMRFKKPIDKTNGIGSFAVIF